MGAADTEGRLAASVGELDAVAPDFSPALDVPNGGVRCALPALLAVGLLADIEGHLELPKGYYGLDSGVEGDDHRDSSLVSFWIGRGNE